KSAEQINSSAETSVPTNVGPEFWFPFPAKLLIVQIFAVRPHLFPERNQRPPFLGDKNGADLHGRFWFGFLGGGLSPLTACASNLRVTLTAAWLISSSEQRPSSIRTPDFLLKVSASSRFFFTFS